MTVARDLRGKSCIITGGASGLGLEIAGELVEQGAKVAVLDVNSESLQSIAGPNLHPLLCDVTDEHQVKQAVMEVFNLFGSIDILVNNVGILYSAPLISIRGGSIVLHDSEMWNKVLATNLTSTFVTTKYVVERMLMKRTKGVIVNISSISAKGNAGQSAYSSAKAGIESLTKVWAKELAPIGIRCFGVAPGFCDTPSTKAAISEAVLHDTKVRIPLKRLGEASEIAAMVLCGIKNGYLNGKTLEIDGGLVI